jgi:C4-dicarboxylate-specific signal transduction histidine kinase
MTATRKARTKAPRAVTPAEIVLGLCHEVGNLLAATRLAAHLMANGLAGPDPAATAAEIEAEAARAGAFLGHVRPLLGVGESRRLRVPATEVLGALERSLGAAAGGPPQLAIRPPRGVPDVCVDPDALHHVLVALSLAAADVTKGRGHVNVSAARVGTRVVFTIQDDGGPVEPGPPPGVAPRRGRPLVLAAAAAVLKGQGGSVRVKALPRGAGTSVALALPAARPYAASRSARRDSGSRTAAGGSRRSHTTPTAARARRT